MTRRRASDNLTHSLYVDAGRDYLCSMASVLTVHEQSQTSAAARAVGGYEELLRLEKERRKLERQGIVARVRKDASGRYALVRS